MEVNCRIKAVRVEHGFTQADIVEALGLTGTSAKVIVSMIENGHVMPTVSIMRTLCELFHCKPDDLYGKEDLDICLSDDWKRTDTVSLGASKELSFATHVLGYASVGEWFEDMSRRTVNEAKIVNAADRFTDFSC